MWCNELLFGTAYLIEHVWLNKEIILQIINVLADGDIYIDVYVYITRLIVLCKNDLKAYAGTAAVNDNISYIFYNKL